MTASPGTLSPAVDAEPLLERLRVCALAAVQAAREGDVERLRGLVEERETLMARAEPLLARARAVAADPAARQPLLLALQGVRAADARLLAELEAHCGALGEELRGLQRGARSDGYRAGQGPGRHLDLRR